MKATIWSLMMLAWLGGLLFAGWWVWPHFEQAALTAELIMATLWLTTGTAAWLLALNMGRQRFWPR